MQLECHRLGCGVRSIGGGGRTRAGEDSGVVRVKGRHTERRAGLRHERRALLAAVGPGIRWGTFKRGPLKEQRRRGAVRRWEATVDLGAGRRRRPGPFENLDGASAAAYGWLGSVGDDGGEVCGFMTAGSVRAWIARLQACCELGARVHGTARVQVDIFAAEHATAAWYWGAGSMRCFRVLNKVLVGTDEIRLVAFGFPQ
mmetsp:Transcript_18437/g.31793  ORF Transcript_18437/g.31793 Transcript_18437/m.31793 type:complete len:200 (-) Transcript_18437:786-1385(-)